MAGSRTAAQTESMSQFQARDSIRLSESHDLLGRLVYR